MNFTINGADVTGITSIGLTINENQDRSLDTGMATIFPLSTPIEYPRGCQVIITEGSERKEYVLVSDAVAQVSRGASPKWSHTIQYASPSREAAFHLVRGVDLTQPKSGSDFSVVCNETQRHYSGSYVVAASYRPAYPIHYKKKISSAVLSVSMYEININSGVYSFRRNSSCYLPNAYVIGVSQTGVETTLFTIDQFLGDGDYVNLTAQQIQAIQSAYSIRIGHQTINGMPDSTEFFGVVNARIDFHCYYYTLLDCVQAVIDASHRPSDVYNSEAGCVSVPPSGAFRDFLASSEAPDFNFSQGRTLWDCLSEIYDSFDAMPTVESGVLGVKYYNERTSRIDTLTFVAKSSSASDESGVDGAVCSYQNGSFANPVLYPGKTGFVKPTSSVVGVPESNTFVIDLKNPIKKICKALSPLYHVTMTIYNHQNSNMSVSGIDIDLTDFVPEKDPYSLLSQSSEAKPYPTQYNSFWYEKGSEFVYVGNINSTVVGTSYAYSSVFKSALARMLGLTDSFQFATELAMSLDSVDAFGSLQDKPWNIMMRLEYIPQKQGALRVESPTRKRDGEFNVAQGSGIVSLEKVGASLMGISAMSGQPTRGAEAEVSSFGARPKAGGYYEDSSGMWVAESIKNTVVSQTKTKSEMSLTKDFNQLSSRVKIDHEVRFTNISEELVLSSEVIYQEYACFTKKGDPSSEATSIHALKKTALACSVSSLVSSSDWEAASPSFGMFSGRADGQALNRCFFPIVCYGAGNAVCFEGGFSSPISAGNRLTATPAGWFSYDLASVAFPYSDPVGFVDDASVWLCPDGSVSDFSSLPSIPAPSSRNVRFDYLSVSKRPNETISLNYETVLVSWRSDSGEAQILIYRSMAEECYPVSKSQAWGLRLFYLKDGDVPYSSFEAKAYGHESSAPALNVALSDSIPNSDYAYCASLTLMSAQSQFGMPEACVGWMIADRHGSPLVACNEPLGQGASVSFRVFSSHSRPE